MKKTTLPVLAIAALASLASCEKKSEEQKKIEAATEQAVQTGEITKDQAKEVNKAAATMEDAQADARKKANDLLEKLEKATTGDELKEAIREATKEQMEALVKAGQMTKEQADATLLSQETSLNALSEEQLRAQIEAMKQALKQAK